MAALPFVSGMAIAPTLIASVAVTQSVVPQSRLTEALARGSTGIAGGLALGAAALAALWVRARPVPAVSSKDVRAAPRGTPAGGPPPDSARSR